jgi:hypothetical protein
MWGIRLFSIIVLLVPFSSAQEEHHHAASAQLGTVSFPVSCLPAVQDQFNRGIALIHSFDYSAARTGFQAIAEKDPHCAMAQWGIAFSYYRQLWDPPLIPASISVAHGAIERAGQLGRPSEREAEYIHALFRLPR